MQKKYAVPLFAAALVAAGVAVPAYAATPVLQFNRIQFDSPGKDTRSNASLNAEFVRIVNRGGSAVNIGTYTIKDVAGHTFRFPTYTLNAGRTVYVHTGRGTNGINPTTGRADSSRLYWNSGNYIWNNPGDTATLRSATGRIYDTCKWTKTGSGVTVC